MVSARRRLERFVDVVFHRQKTTTKRSARPERGVSSKIGWVGVRQGGLTSCLKLLTVGETDCGARCFTSPKTRSGVFQATGE